MARASTGFGEEGGPELVSHIFTHVTREPRTLVKASLGNGLEAWRRLKTRHNPVTPITVRGHTARSIQPGKVKDIRHLQSAIEQWAEESRLSECGRPENAGAAVYEVLLEQM